MVVLAIIHVTQSLFSLYGLAISYISISNLQTYESQTQKAAKWSNTVADQLHRTRTTQASGALSILASLLSSFVLATSSSSIPTGVRVFINGGLVGVLLGARTHISNFWKASAKVPFADGYNEAISRTEEMMKVTFLLAGMWVVSLAGTLALGS